MVLHDDTVDRTTDGHGKVEALTVAELRRFDAGSWKGREFAGERIPTFDEVIAAVPQRILLFAELKDGSARSPGIEDALARFIRERGVVERVRVSSFDHRALARLRPLVPDLETGALFTGLPVDLVALARNAALVPVQFLSPMLAQGIIARYTRQQLRVGLSCNPDSGSWRFAFHFLSSLPPCRPR